MGVNAVLNTAKSQDPAVAVTLSCLQRSPDHVAMSEIKIGQIVREIREKKGLGLNYVATEAEVDRGNYSKFERDEFRFRDESLKRIAEVIGTTIWRIYLRAEEEDYASKEAWHDVGGKLEPDQRSAAIRLLSPKVDKQAEGDK